MPKAANTLSGVCRLRLVTGSQLIDFSMAEPR